MKQVIRRGFELLKTRPSSDKAIEEIERLEEVHNIRLPFKFKSFATLFYFELVNTFDEVLDRNLRVSDVEYLSLDKTDGRVFIDQLLPLDFCLDTYRENEFWFEMRYMQFASGPSDGGILVGMEGEVMDKILVNDGHKYVELANDIFDFFRNVVVIQKSESDLENGVRYSQLFKNWGDSKWRIRED